MKSFKEFLTEITIKLGSNNSNALNAFLEEFDKETTPNPFFHRMRIWNDSIGFEVYKFDGSIHIASVISLDKKNSGNGSTGMKWLTGLADKHGVKLDLAVKPIKNAGAKDGINLNKAQLKAWYKRNGFISVGSDHMVRTPQK